METPGERFERLTQRPAVQPNTRQKRRCSGITHKGTRCRAWALTGGELCAGHAGINLDAAHSARREQAAARKDARLSVRERAARALDDDWPQVLAALRRGLEDKDAGKAARTAVAYVQLVYGRQLQQPEDEQPADPLDVSAMTREQRNALKRRILEKHPHLVQELTGDIGESGA